MTITRIGLGHFQACLSGTWRRRSGAAGVDPAGVPNVDPAGEASRTSASRKDLCWGALEVLSITLNADVVFPQNGASLLPIESRAGPLRGANLN